MEQFTILPIFAPLIILFLVFNIRTLNLKIIPSNWQLLEESLYKTILSILIENLTIKRLSLFPLVFTIFNLVFISNFLGLIPYSSTPSVELIITLTLAFTLLIGIFINGIFHHGFFPLFHIFLPSGTPIFLLPLMIPLEILAYITRTLSLGLRLAVNLITGHILVKVILSFISLLPTTLFFIPFIFITIFLSLEVLISYLQAYIFIFITTLTFKDLL